MQEELRKYKVDMEVVYAKALANIKRVHPEHMIFTLNSREQKELLEHLLKAQGYHIKLGIEKGERYMTLPGLGTFKFNPLRIIAKNITRELKDKLEDFEIKQIIQEKLADFIETHGNPFTSSRAVVYRFNINKDKANND